MQLSCKRTLTSMSAEMHFPGSDTGSGKTRFPEVHLTALNSDLRPLKPDPGIPQIHLCSSHGNVHLLACLLKCTSPVLGRFWQNRVPGSAPETAQSAVRTAETRSWECPNPPMHFSWKRTLTSMSAETHFPGSGPVLAKPGSRKCS